MYMKLPMYLFFIWRVDLMMANPLFEPMEGVGPENLEFLGSQMALAYQLDAISQVPRIKKLSNSRAQPLPVALVMDMHASKTLCTRLYISQVLK